MFWRFLQASLPLVILGICLGLLARSIFGVPEDAAQNERKFSPAVKVESSPNLLDEESFEINPSDLPWK